MFRCIFSARNAEYQVRALTLGGTIDTLTPGEAELAGSISTKTTGLMRSWEYWTMRVAKAGGMPLAAKKKAAGGQAAARRQDAPQMSFAGGRHWC